MGTPDKGLKVELPAREEWILTDVPLPSQKPYAPFLTFLPRRTFELIYELSAFSSSGCIITTIAILHFTLVTFDMKCECKVAVTFKKFKLRTELYTFSATKNSANKNYKVVFCAWLFQVVQ